MKRYLIALFMATLSTTALACNSPIDCMMEMNRTRQAAVYEPQTPLPVQMPTFQTDNLIPVPQYEQPRTVLCERDYLGRVVCREY